MVERVVERDDEPVSIISFLVMRVEREVVPGFLEVCENKVFIVYSSYVPYIASQFFLEVFLVRE